MLLRYFLSDFEIVPIVPTITGVTFVFIFHMCCISTVRWWWLLLFYYLFIYLFL
jgi:hypothetical protein